MPRRAAYADNFGLKQKLWRRFKVTVACYSKKPYYLAGSLGLAAHRHVIKCALNVYMDLSSELRLGRCGGTNWYLILLLSKCFCVWIMPHHKGCGDFVDSHS